MFLTRSLKNDHIDGVMSRHILLNWVMFVLSGNKALRACLWGVQIPLEEPSKRDSSCVGQTHTVDLRAEKREFFQFHPLIPGNTTMTSSP